MLLEAANRFLERPVQFLVKWTNAVGAGVLGVLVCFTTADVVLRYVFNRPILGSVEVTEFMMAVVAGLALAYTALRRGHISVDIITSRLSSRVQAAINIIVCFLTLAVFAMITWRLTLYAEMLRLGKFTSGSLLIPVFPFVYVVAFGSALVCIILLINLLNQLDVVVKAFKSRALAIFVLLGVLIVVLFASPIWGADYIFQVSPISAGLIGVLLLIVVLFSGIFVGMAMLLVGFLGMVYANSLNAGLGIIGTSPYETLATYLNSVVPLFVLMGSFCFYSGLSKDLYNAADKWLGRLPGGLAMATTGACAAFAAVSGSSTATVATIGTVALPEMKKYNYESSLATGCVAAGGSMGILIPPSIVLVIYGVITEQPIGKLLLAGFIPGVLEAVFYIITIFILCSFNPLLGPRGASSTLKEKMASLKNTWGVLALFVLVLGGIYVGIFTPTEAAGIGAFGAFIYALIRKGFSWQTIKNSLNDTTNITGMAFLILIGGILFGYFLAVSRLPFEISEIVAGLGINRYLILIGIIIIYLFLGCIMSALAMIILTVPIFFPVLVALGFDPIWFGIIAVRCVEIGQITPPVGLNVYIIKGIAKDVPMSTIFRGIVPFLIADFCHVAMLIVFPQVVLFIPNMMD